MYTPSTAMPSKITPNNRKNAVLANCTAFIPNAPFLLLQGTATNKDFPGIAHLGIRHIRLSRTHRRIAAGMLCARGLLLQEGLAGIPPGLLGMQSAFHIWSFAASLPLFQNSIVI